VTGAACAAAPVLVGVDGSRAARQAVRWAALEARLLHRPLLIAHVERPAHDAAGLPGDESMANGLLTLSREAATEDGQVDVRTAVVPAAAVSDALVQLAESAAVLALGIDVYRSRASHGALGPLEDRVAVHAACPVVLVAPFADVTPRAGGLVVTGWSPAPAGRLALEVAAVQASLRSARLAVVTVEAREHPPGAAERVARESELTSTVVELERRHPGLVIDIRHFSGDVANAIGSTMASADLLVLGCHHSRQPWNIRTGPIAETLARDGRCPVMLVGHRSAVAVPTPPS
jgi:nucleotide-binding universal stress UspA family protein